MSDPGSRRSVKRVAILGSTGSIGQSALSVIERHADRLQVVGLAAGENVDRLSAQIARHRPRVVAVASDTAAARLQAGPSWSGAVRLAGIGRSALVEVATLADVDIVLCASSGTEALEAVLAAIEHGK